MIAREVGLAGTIYLIGQVVGALVFGRLADRLDGASCSSSRWSSISRAARWPACAGPSVIGTGRSGSCLVFRFVAGAGIGGEYAAINSAIDELIPRKYRGHVDIAINGTYWGGAALGALANSVFLNRLLPDNMGLAARLLHRADRSE